MHAKNDWKWVDLFEIGFPLLQRRLAVNISTDSSWDDEDGFVDYNHPQTKLMNN